MREERVTPGDSSITLNSSCKVKSTINLKAGLVLLLVCRKYLSHLNSLMHVALRKASHHIWLACFSGIVLWPQDKFWKNHWTTLNQNQSLFLKERDQVVLLLNLPNIRLARVKYQLGDQQGRRGNKKKRRRKRHSRTLHSSHQRSSHSSNSNSPLKF